MDSFNWADSIRATLGHCLPCVQPDGDSDDELEQSRATARRGTAREELERLLDAPMTDYEEDAETMSLHSNLGRAGKNKRAKRQKKKRSANNAPVRKSVRVFGIDLFGRRPIALEESDDEEGVNGADGSRRPRTISTSTLDSDAAPLGDDAITNFTARAHQRWAPSQTDEELRVEEALERERVEKEMRKGQRKERKQMKRLAEQGAFTDDGNGEFEGFPGSGYGPMELRSPTTAGGDDFGPFITSEEVASSSQGPKQRDEGKDEEEDADFDASAYTKKRRQGGEGSRSGSGSGSHTRSRSRTSASVSTEGTKTHHRSSKSNPKSPLSEPSSDITSPPKERKSSSKSGTKKSKRTKSSVTSSSATQSLPSPALTPSADVHIHSQDFDGVPGGLDSARDHLTAYAQSSFPSPGLSNMPSAGFPSTGFGNFKRSTSGLNSTAGVALARRGDD